MTERRLVAVSWSMPPALFPRSIQISRLLKGLQRQGWRNTVITLRNADRPRLDPADPMLSELYSEYFEPEYVPLSTREVELPHISSGLVRQLGGQLDAIDRVWLARSAAAVNQAVVLGRAEVLVTFAQPWRDHFVGLARRRPRPPWVAHFSDPWVDSLYYSDLPKDQAALHREREASVIGNADRVVFTNGYAADLVMRKYPVAWQRKVRVVPHAADLDLLHLIQPSNSSMSHSRKPLRLSFVGSLLVDKRTADTLLDAVAQMEREQTLAGRLEITIVGSGSGTAQSRERVERLGLASLVTFRPHVPYLESLAVMRESDGLILIDAAADVNVFFPSKLVDYVAAERPIMAITPLQGPSADVVRQCGYPVIAPGDVEAVMRTLKTWMSHHSNGALRGSTPRNVLETYSVERVAASFATILDEAINDFDWKRRWF